MSNPNQNQKKHNSSENDSAGRSPQALAENSAKTVRAKVRPGNTYGKQPAGSIVDVTPSELALVPHCLVALDGEGNEVTVATPKSNTAAQAAEGNRMFATYRNMHQQNAAARKDGEEINQIRQVLLESKRAQR